MVSTDLSFLFANKTAETLDMSGTANSAVRQENAETLGTSGHHEIGRRQETAETLDTSGLAQMQPRSSVRRLPCSGRTLHEMVCWKSSC